jgi:hypothetical protein
MYFYLAKYIALKNDIAIVEDSEYLIPSNVQIGIEQARETIYLFLTQNGHSQNVNIIISHFEEINEVTYTALIQ